MYLSHAVLILASFLSVFPLYYMICGATNPSIDVVRGKLIPGTYLIENFKNLIANQNLGLAMTNSFRNSILLTLACEMNDRIYSEPGNRLGKVAAAIWPWKCKDALFRYNDVTDTRLNQDGMAYDADSGDGTVYEYNYSRMNEGGCVMFCLEEAIHNTFRHNVSYDDLGGTISPASNPDARLEQNIFYVRDGVPFVRNHMDGGNYTESNDRIIPIEK